MASSDEHFGDGGQLLTSLRLTEEKALGELEDLKPDEIEILRNGDRCAGTGIFRQQSYQNIVQYGREQVWWAAWEEKTFYEKCSQIAPTTIHICRGNHDHAGGKEDLASQYVAVLHLLGIEARYHQREYFGNFAPGEPDERFWYHAEHGALSASQYYANSYSVIRAAWRKHIEASRDRDIIIRRYIRAHAHWFNIGQAMGGDVAIDTTGGWHRQERLRLSDDVRDTGFLLYVCDGKSLDVRQVFADREMLVAEAANRALHYQNMRRASLVLEEVTRWGITKGLW